MTDQSHIAGLHHVTYIAGNPQQNLDFYSGILGQRFIKKTVNFDDPGTYHFYFADYKGTPGSVMTSFPWPRSIRGKAGAGQCVIISYAIPQGAADYWKERLEKFNVSIDKDQKLFGNRTLSFSDPDGIGLEISEVENPPEISHWEDGPVPLDYALRGFLGTTLLLNEKSGTEKLLIETMGYKKYAEEGNRYRYQSASGGFASMLDIIEDPSAPAGEQSVGTVHHIAFRVKNDEEHSHWREKFIKSGMRPTPFIDRDYFHSIYFRTPGHVLFEVATENPGFDKDEELEALGEALRIPNQHKIIEDKIENVLPKVVLPSPSDYR